MKRSDRLVSMTNYLVEHPMELISLPFFSEKCGAAKSSISEDLGIINRMLTTDGIGYLESTPGAAGGVRYVPRVDEARSEAIVNQLCTQLEDPSRILPGGYLYMSDILGNPSTVKEIGRLFAARFANLNIDSIVTVATKGIPLAYAVASYLNVPVVIVRRDPKVTEGSTVSINYVSGSSKKIQTMVLSKRSLRAGENVCIIDDFMKAGGTINGIKSLLKEFDTQLKAIGVLAEAEDDEEDRVVDEYISLLQINNVDSNNQEIEVIKGNYFTAK